MRLIVARCAVDYTGRLTAHLPEALRLIIVKADGSVLVHADAGGYKPLKSILTCSVRPAADAGVRGRPTGTTVVSRASGARVSDASWAGPGATCRR